MSRKTISSNSLLQMARKQRNLFATSGQRMTQLSSDGDYQRDRTMDDAINEQPDRLPAVTTGSQSTNYGRTNRQVSLDNHVPRVTRRQSIVNNQREQSILVDDELGPGNNNDAANYDHDPPADVFEKPKVRGYTHMPHVWAISSKGSNLKRLTIEFNKCGKPVGPNKSGFVEFLGTIVRNGNKAPLNYETWHKLPSSFKDDMLEKVKTTYIVPCGYDKLVKQALGRSWKAFKCRIKTAYFDKELTLEQNLRRRPDKFDERVKEDQWKFLVEYWCDDKTKRVSEKNKENRAMKKMQHNTGKRSFAQVYEMEMAKREILSDAGLGENDMNEDENLEEINDLTIADMFLKCYSRDGNTSNPEVANALEKMQHLKSQLPPGERDEGPRDIFSQVLGDDKGGRVRMQSSGITSKRIYGGDSMGDDDADVINERLKKELQEKNMIIERLLRNEDLRGLENIRNLSFQSTSQNAGLAKSALPPAPLKSAKSFASPKSALPSAPLKSAKSFAPPKPASTHVQLFEHNQSRVPIKPLRPLASANVTPPFETTNSTPVKSAPHTFANSLPLQIGAQVFLKSFIGNEYVAKGSIVSLSSSKLVGNEELGNGWCEVKVTVGIKSKEELIKKIGSVKTIQQAVGRSIAWPKHLVDRQKLT